MAKLDFNVLLGNMVNAAKDSLAGNWPAISNLATTSLKTLAHNLIDIEQMRIDGTITPEQANLLVDMQKNALKTVLLSEEGLGLLAAEAAINAVLDAVKTAVNAALGFPLI
ncbi:MAG: hypothetical protein Q8941_06400 [Bacteroidota bacterium]|nr:hypothetical protein [Bacteroidota bacterium]